VHRTKHHHTFQVGSGVRASLGRLFSEDTVGGRVFISPVERSGDIEERGSPTLEDFVIVSSALTSECSGNLGLLEYNL